ncbi:MAG: bifunctional nuclease family protein [Blastocatellia bacterium]|nr:bifunctional nuclease family protein [Blastocatellia bacterium]MBL8195635.1 bifunctional nuclease family protein [Blastocatellia bacterium]MBN8725712.1 bifunctional nuclease family protein [Acidobacteriota bacterium]
MEIEMKIRGLMIDPSANTPIVILKDINSDTLLPIWVGAYEANAIALEIEKIAPQRPMTHDLLKNVIEQMGARVQRIVITSLVDNVFYAVIELMSGESTVFLDSRPSDAIALALRSDCPIYVNEEVIKNSRNTVSEKTSLSDIEDEMEKEEEEVEWPDEIDDSDMNKYKM